MRNNNFSWIFFIPLLSTICGVQFSLTSISLSHPLLERKLESIEQLFTPNNEEILTQTRESETDLIYATGEPLKPRNDNLRPVSEAEKLRDNNFVLVNHRAHSSSVFVAPIAPNPRNRLFYPSESFDRHK